MLIKLDKPYIRMLALGLISFLAAAAVTKPFSIIDGKVNVVGFDIEQGLQLKVVNIDFGEMILFLIRCDMT